MDTPAQDFAPSKKSNLILFVGLVVLLVFIGGLAYVLFAQGSLGNLFGFSRPKTVTRSVPIQSQTNLNPSPIATACIPAPKLDKSDLAFYDQVKNVYGIRGKVLEIRKTSKSTELVTDTKGENVPRFFATSKTEVIFSSDGKDLSGGKVSDIKVGQNLVFTMNCNTNQTWSAVKIRIVKE